MSAFECFVVAGIWHLVAVQAAQVVEPTKRPTAAMLLGMLAGFLFFAAGLAALVLP